MVNRIYNVKVAYDAAKMAYSMTSPTTGVTITLVEDGNTPEINDIKHKIRVAVEEAASQFGKGFISGGTILPMTLLEIQTFYQSFLSVNPKKEGK